MPPGRRSVVQLVADPTGVFRADLPAAGAYVISATHPDFFPLLDRPAELRDGANEITLALNHVHNTSESVNVSGAPAPVDVEQTGSDRPLSGRQMFEVPYPSTHDLHSALTLTPGVVRDAGGALHFDGGTENQVQYQLNGFDISDPLTGTFNTHLVVDAVRSAGSSSAAAIRRSTARVRAARWRCAPSRATIPGAIQRRISCPASTPGRACGSARIRRA